MTPKFFFQKPCTGYFIILFILWKKIRDYSGGGGYQRGMLQEPQKHLDTEIENKGDAYCIV